MQSRPNSFGHAVSSEFIGRAQCVAKGIRLEDFDFSVGKLLQEGGMLALTQLRDKYPQLAYYINLAAVAIEFIVKVFQKYPMKIVPTLIQTSDGKSFGATTNNGSGSSKGSGSSGGYGNGYSSSGSSSYSQPSANNSFPPSASFNPAFGSANSANSGNSVNSGNFQPVKITVYAESQPSDTDQVTAYPVVVQKWQSEPDPEIISLNPPIPVEPCLHAGTNILKSTDISKDESQDTFTRDFKLNVSSANGFAKTFPLKKNIGAGGWELNLTPEDLNSFPKISMTLEAEVTGTRGFNELKSPPFVLPLNTGTNWQLKPESAKAFAVGGRRLITLQNLSGTCRCLQAVIYKPSFGGQFVFEANAKNPNNQLQYSADGREVSFEIDATNFQPGQGTLEMKTYGDNQPPSASQQFGQTGGQKFNQPNIQTGAGGSGSNGSSNGSGSQGSGQNQSSNILNIKLYPLPPEITDFRIAGGDRQASITGSRLEQLQWIKVNGKKMILPGNGQALGTRDQGNKGLGGYGNQTPTSSVSLNTSTAQSPNPISVPNQMSGNPSSLLNSFVPNFIGVSPNGAAAERTFVFEDQTVKQEGGIASLELGLEDDRSFLYPVQFKVKPSRPTIVANTNNEIEGMIVNHGGDKGDGNNFGTSNQNVPAKNPNNINRPKRQPALSSQLSVLSLKDVFPIETGEISVQLQNALTDYDFKPENLTVETRIENGGANAGEMPRPVIEVFDWKSMRLNLQLNEQISKIIGGRRLQFRIRDRERGDSDWYTIKQTFVRIPEIKSVRCTNEMNGQCEMKGFGIEYVGQVSTDGGKSWFPGENGALQIRQTADGQSVAMILLLENKKLLMIKFRDYPKMDGIAVTNFSFANSVRAAKRNNAPDNVKQVSSQPTTTNSVTNSVPANVPNSTLIQNSPQPLNPTNPVSSGSEKLIRNQTVKLSKSRSVKAKRKTNL